MKMKKKGKVYPSPPPPLPPSSSSSSSQHDSLSVLKLLPATILVLVSVLSAEDKEVLAYLITRSLATTTTTISTKANSTNPSSSKSIHKPPIFDCECFDCYTNYWFKWDSSPNRELIHKIIEAFEDHLTTDENSSSRKSNGRSKKSRRVKPKVKPIDSTTEISVPDEIPVNSHVSSPENSPESLGRGEVDNITEEESAVVFTTAAANKGLARKVLPDVLGLFNSHFWRLWNPNGWSVSKGGPTN